MIMVKITNTNRKNSEKIKNITKKEETGIAKTDNICYDKTIDVCIYQ